MVPIEQERSSMKFEASIRSNPEGLFAVECSARIHIRRKVKIPSLDRGKTRPGPVRQAYCQNSGLHTTDIITKYPCNEVLARYNQLSRDLRVFPLCMVERGSSLGSQS